MSYQHVDMWRVICNRCGGSAQEGDYYAWADKDGADAEADDSEWLVSADGHWCPDCTVWDDDKDERVPSAAPLPAVTA